MTGAIETLAGWGHAPVVPGRELRSEDLEAITGEVPLTRGLGRAYGDAALPAPNDVVVAGSRLATRLLSFDSSTRVLRAESGASLDQLYRVFLPRGYFTPVSPGTRFVTLGGMVAADVHGKNHHVDGCIGRHVESLAIRVADGSIVNCSPAEHGDLFSATIGGMGLTGHILRVALRLTRVPSPWICQESQRIDSLGAFIEALKHASAEWPMTVGWMDGVSPGAFGRGILYKGRWARPDEAPTRFPQLGPSVPVPAMLPRGWLGRPLVRAFNTLNYHAHGGRVRKSVVSPRKFFYPLDALEHWYRLYGRDGFTQYQCVLPHPDSGRSARRVLETVTQSGAGSYLCVIKDCGAEGNGTLSFPRPGISLALDVPMRRDTQTLVDRLNEIVIAEGGRIYLAKDALTRANHFRAMEPRLDAFLAARQSWDPHGRIRSAQSVRLFGW